MRARLLRALLFSMPCASITGQAVWTVDRAPILDVPGLSLDGEVMFGYPAGATRLSDGSLLVADRADNGIRVIDATGKLVRTVGREGDGPGEYRSMIWAGGCGADSLLVWDMARRQATLIGASGAAARQFAVPAGDTAQSPYRFSCASHRAMAYLSVPRPARGGTAQQDPNVLEVSAALYRVARDGTIMQRLGEIPAGEMLVLTSPTGGRGSAPRPMGRAATMAMVGDDIVVGSPDSATATVAHPDGTSDRIVIPLTRRAPTRAEFDAAIQATASMIPARLRQEMVTALAATPMPERLPAISGVFGDPEGLLWVQGSPVGATVVDLVVMRVSGRVVARVRVPAPLTVHEIGLDYVLGSYADADDEPHIAVYRLRRP